MQILSIEAFRRKKILITFDTGGKLAIYQTEGQRYGLKEGEALSEEAYGELVRDVLIPRGRKRVLHLLEAMDRTEAELRQKLKESYFPDEVVEDAIAYAKKLHYIDDERYLRNYLTGQLRKKSFRQVALELERKEIDRGQLQRAMEELRINTLEIEEEAAGRLLGKRLGGSTEPEDIFRAKQYLFRKGFSYDIIEKAVRAYRDNSER